jgi:hypothetical protein
MTAVPFTTFQLSNGTEVVVDVDDLWRLQGRAWHLAANVRVATTERQGDKRRTIYLARVIAEVTDPHMVVDHINHNPLDNRKENLRICEQKQNTYNRRIGSNNTSGFLGVTKYKDRWRARVGKNGLHKVAGTFETAEEAARARDALARQLYGAFASLNFPDGDTTVVRPVTRG